MDVGHIGHWHVVNRTKLISVLVILTCVWRYLLLDVTNEHGRPDFGYGE